MGTELNFQDVLAISPLLILLFGGLSLILVESFGSSKLKSASVLIAVATFFIAFVAALWAPASQSVMLTNWLYFDSLGRFFQLFFLLVGAASCLIAIPFFRSFKATQGEYLFLLIASVAGLLLISSAADFLTLFLGIETLSIPLYVLCAYMKRWRKSGEAATKYFLLGALSAGFLLYGIALVYGAVGTTRFDELLAGYQAIENSADKALFLGGAGLITLGLAFKAAVVPLHVWAPDVYDGAPTPVTAFMAVGTKIGAFAAFIRVFALALPEFNLIWNQMIALLVYPTLIYANLVALKQVHIRRFFAYSGIAHAGILLIPLAVGGPQAIHALLFYLVVYALATLCCFAVIAFIDTKEGGVHFHDLNGLFNRAPLLALVLSFSLLTLAGIPPTAGFLAKFYVFKIAYEAGFYGLVAIGLLTTIFSAYYYLRLIAIMFSKPAADEHPTEEYLPVLSLAVLCFVATIALSVYPEPFLKLITALDNL